MTNGVVPSLARAAFLAAILAGARGAGFSTVRPPCGSGLFADSSAFVGVSGPGRRVSSLVIVCAGDRVRYTETWRVDTITTTWTGEIRFGDGIPQTFVATRWRNGVTSATESVERVGDTLVTIRNGRRTTRMWTGDVPVPGLRSFPVQLALVSAALGRPDHVIGTTGMGKLRVREIAHSIVEENGRSMRERLLQAQSDSDSGGMRIWLDDQNHFFASTDADGPADVTLPEAWARSADDVLLAQAHAGDDKMIASARSMGEESPNGFLFVGGSVIDVERGVAMPNTSVLVRGSRIERVAPDSSLHPPPGVTIIDVRGKWIAPGLWDLGQAFSRPGSAEGDGHSRALLSRGVTSVQDLNADTLLTHVIEQRLRTRAQIGPTLYSACFMDGWYPDSILGGVPPRIGERGQVRDSADVQRLLARCHDLGIHVVTLYPLVPPRLARFAIAEGHRRGMIVSGDALRGMSTLDLLALGYDQFGHIGQVLMPFVQVGDTAFGGWALGRLGGGVTFVAKGKELANLDLDSAAIASTIRELGRRHTIIESSICVYEAIGRRGDSLTSARGIGKFKELATRLHAAGARLVLATDDACTVGHELQLLRDAGYSNAELLRLGTIGAAEAAGHDKESGDLKEGKQADLLVLDADPLADIRNLERLSLVVKAGTLYRNPAGLRSRGQ